MKSKFTLGRLLLFLTVGMLLAVGAGFLFPSEYTTEQAVERVFEIEENFTKVRKIMVRTNAAKEIVTMGGESEFIEQRWEDGNAQLAAENESNSEDSKSEQTHAVLGKEKIGQVLLRNVLSQDPGWRFDLQGTLKIRTLNDTIGHEIIELEQAVQIEPDTLQSQVKLSQGTDRLLGYEMTTQLGRAAEQTQVKLALKEKIKIEVPWFAHGIADRRVRASIQQSLVKQEQAMRQLLRDNADKAGLFPLR